MKRTIDRRDFLAAAGAGTLAALLAPWGATPAKAETSPGTKEPGGTQKPNIIFILADDLGYEGLSCNGGNYKTPHLDALAAGGMRFEHAHAQPLCTPTRVQLMTGIYNVRNYRRFGQIEPDVTTFGHLLKKAGYETAIAGKWQLGHGFDGPKMLGFDEYCLWQLTRRPPRYVNPGLEINGKEIDYTHGEYGPDLVSDYAIDFIQRKKDKPFFLYYSMMLTHDPYLPTPDSKEWNPKATGEKGHDRKFFADNIAYMDKLVGKLMATLDANGLREKTLVVFLGDNGTMRGVKSTVGDAMVTGGKGTTTTFGTHVPMIANWPRTVPAGKVSRDLIDTTDFLPTFCEAAGTNVPAELRIDGHSFLPQLRGQAGTPREWMYSWYAPNQNKLDVPKEFAATKQYKLYRSGEFYDYVGDPEEQKPLDSKALSPEAAAQRRMLQGALDRYKDARPAKLDTPTTKARR